MSRLSDCTAEILAILPDHKCGLHLTHNEHRDYRQTVEAWEEDTPGGSVYWVSEEERKKAQETDELWTLQWYPETPVGFCFIAASSLIAILDRVGQGR